AGLVDLSEHFRLVSLLRAELRGRIGRRHGRHERGEAERAEEDETVTTHGKRRCKDDPRPETLADGADRVMFVTYDTSPFRPGAPPTLTPCRRFSTCRTRLRRSSPASATA